MSRFVNQKKRENAVLPLSNDDYIVIKTRLTNREQRKIDAAGVRVMASPGDKQGKVDVDVEALDFERVSVMLLEWSFKDDNGAPVQLNRDNLAVLDDASFKEIVAAIDGWKEEQEAGKNGEPPVTGEEPTESLKAIGG